jgi:hypothetical protein
MLKSIAFSYDPREDRVLAAVNPGQPDAWSCWLTRRLVLAVLDKLPSMVEATSAVVQQAPAAFRSDMVAFEREAAIATTAKSMTNTPDTVLKSGAVSAELAERLTISGQGNGLRMELQGDRGGEAAGMLARADMQRLLLMLATEVAKAAWLGLPRQPAVASPTEAPAAKPVRH